MTVKNQFEAMADYFRSMLTPAGATPETAPEVSREDKPAVLSGEPRQEEDGTEEQAADGGLQPRIEVQTQVAARPVIEKDESELASVARLIEKVKPETETVTAVQEEVAVAASEPEAAVATPEPEVRIAEPAAVADVAAEEKVQTLEAAQVRQQADTPAASAKTGWANISVEDEFQALFFVVHGVTFAVPLTDLGTIAELDKVTSIFGKPEWFMGLMNHRDLKLNVVDFVKWAMPNVAGGSDDFKYTIQLQGSKWSITCDELLGNEYLNKSSIQWRSTAGKRPWLAGLVKDKMCALVHVDELIKLFEQGINIEGEKS